MVDCDPNFILPKDGTLGAVIDIVLLDSFLPLFSDPNSNYVLGGIKIDVEGF